VFLGDDIIGGAPTPCMRQLLDVYERHDGPVVAVERVPRDRIHQYGVIAGRNVGDNVWQIDDLVEKPPVGEAPSDLGVLGRYILSPKIFDKLETTQRGAGGEIQLTDAIRALTAEQPVFGYEFEGVRHDAGTRLGWLKANIAMSLESDLADEVRAHVRSLDLRD
jgi:UTP--glucose-1-phosphate uridylyltransferase